MDKRFLPESFNTRNEGKSLEEVKAAIQQELAAAADYDPADQVEVCYIDVYRQFLNNLDTIISTGQKPAGVNDHEVEKTKPVIESLVADKQLDPGVLHTYLHH